MKRARVSSAFFAVVAAVASLSCDVGQGEGEVRSERLFARECADGELDLRPNFFAVNPHEGALTFRLQRGDLMEEASDGLILVVNDVSAIRGDEETGEGGKLDQDLPLGLPVGVAPPGVPIVYQDDPPVASLSLYLNDSCDEQNVSLYSVSGTIRFASLFSGDPKEEDAADRLTEASFDAVFADPRDLVPGEAPDPAVSSRITGNFRFFFQRGQPAQPFP